MADTSHMLSPDTQAILLLCASLHPGKPEAIPPLTLTEYNQLAQWLQTQEMRPGDSRTCWEWKTAGSSASDDGC